MSAAIAPHRGAPTSPEAHQHRHSRVPAAPTSLACSLGSIARRVDLCCACAVIAWPAGTGPDRIPVGVIIILFGISAEPKVIGNAKYNCNPIFGAS